MKPGRKYQTKRAVLLLADGTRFEGDGLGPDATALGEAVFYTGMTGYEEALTDPSYAGQILTFTYPLIGNYGVSRSVSQHPHATTAGCVIKHLARRPSHFENAIDLGSWLEEQAIPTIVGVDTRALTIALREHGTIAAALAVGDKAVAGVDATLAEYVRTMTTAGLVESVSDAYHAGETIGTGSTHIVLLDCGVKRAIIRELEALDARVTVLPFGATRAEIDGHRPDAIVISPGPGDPRDLPATVETLRGLVGEMPLFGVCLGHQLLALACGAQTFKLPYGHRGGNQPVKDLINDEVLITAHNHGYAVDGTTLPDHLEATMVNLNDGTNEGFRHRTLPIAAVQFHPEASPGPFDARGLFRVGWIRFAEAFCITLALLLPAAAARGQDLPRLHITALGLHADQRVVRPGQAFHVTVHVHVREKRDRLDELVLPALTNAVDLGDERKRVPAADGTDFYETLTVAATTTGTASFTPAYIDAIDPATGRGMRYSSQPLSVRVVSGTIVQHADPGAMRLLLRNALLAIATVAVLLTGAIVVLVRLVRRRTRAAPPSAAPPLAAPRTGPGSDPLREALAAYRARGDDASLDVLRGVLFARAGAAPGATFADALRALGLRDPQLGRVMAVAERARFGPVHERAPAARDLLSLLDAYLPDREPVA